MQGVQFSSGGKNQMSISKYLPILRWKWFSLKHKQVYINCVRSSLIYKKKSAAIRQEAQLLLRKALQQLAMHSAHFFTTKQPQSCTHDILTRNYLSRSSKVIDYGTNQKPVYNFILVVNNDQGWKKSRFFKKIKRIRFF